MIPSRSDEDEWISPSAEAIRRAYSLLDLLLERGAPIPLRAVPNGEEGICIEWVSGTFSATYEIDAEGAVEYMAFENGRLIGRQVVQIA